MMRPILLLCFLTLTQAVYGQTIKSAKKPGSSPAENRRLPTDTVADKPFRLRSGRDLGDAYWRFKAGDSTEWAKAAYRDRHWIKEWSPEDALRENKELWEARRGWFRLRFKPDKSIYKNRLNLLINQFGRSEVYLDGRLLTKLVPVGLDSGGSQRITQFVPLPVSDTSQHVLAIRYAFRKDPIFFAELGEQPMKLAVLQADKALTEYQLSEAFGVAIDFLTAGIFGTLSLLHFLFFRANRAQRINRTLCWAMLAFAFAFLADFLSDVTPNLTLDSLVELAGKMGFRVGCVLLLWGVHQYLAIRAGWFFYTVAGLLLLDLLYRAIVGPLPDYINGLAIILAFVAYVRLSWIGRKRNEADARLPWNSLKLAIFCLIGIIGVSIIAGITSQAIGLDFELMLAPIFMLFFVAMLSIPVGLSLSLVQDYTRTSRSLATKLQEVEQLSARTVAQEQEKQQLLARQNETLEQLVGERTAALDHSLTELRATQDQLIQREKLASLGELTAGVAHEIQNPLNFVNNFSEVSVELLAELADEQQRPVDERDAALEQEILGDIKQNIGKISHHGQRAASIVRGMLQHSRASTGQRETTDLNALTDEYLRLAYHGLRAKDKTFEVKLVTRFEPDLPAVSVASQDIGRVLMNLFTNAFYAVQERTQRCKAHPGTYQPTVTVTSELADDKVLIRVHDNGMGIPDEVRSKIFQPFFTTKPTGKGTGLGLSLSYDIVTKGHGGTITVQSEPGEYTEFVVTLPCS